MTSKNIMMAEEYRLIGNEFYNASKYFNALEFYNKSLCHAKPSTEHFALSIANRSAVYFEIGEYDACIENIQMAIAVGYPRNKMKKLSERRNRCQERIKSSKKNPNKDPWNLFKLSYPPNQRIPYIIDDIELRESNQYGRHLITTRNLKAGDIIAIEKPFYKYIANASRYTYCANCLKSEKLNLLPCLKCNYTIFCSRECMSIGHRFHLFECDIDIDLEQESCIFRMCHRVVFEALGVFGDIGKLKEFLENHPEPKTIFDVGDLSKMNTEELNQKLLLATQSLQKNPLRPELLYPMEDHCKLIMSITNNLSHKKFLEKFTRDQMRLIITNSFEMDVDYKEYGAGIFPFASYFNHSCAPNVYRISLDGKLVFIVIRPIKKNEQLFVCYRENFLHTSFFMRQIELYQAYNFPCNCEACIKQFPQIDQLPNYDENLNISSSDSLSLDEIINEYKENCNYINKHHRKYPSYEVCKIIERNYDLLNYIACLHTCFTNIQDDLNNNDEITAE